jgi:hypothetical protein
MRKNRIFLVLILSLSTTLSLQPLPTPIRREGIFGAMAQRYISNSLSTVMLQPCETAGSLQSFNIDSISGSLTLSDGRCLVRNPSAPGGFTAGTCDGSDSTKWSVPSCNVAGCPNASYWLKSNKDGEVAGCPGAIGPALIMWTVDEPPGQCFNELFSISVDNTNRSSVTLRSMNDNSKSGCPSGENVQGWCVSVVPPPPPPPPCRESPRVRCHIGVWGQAPTRTPSNGVVDGPLLGNGDLGSAMTTSNVPGGLTWYIGKSDMWSSNTNVDSADPSLHSDTFYTAISAGRLSIEPTLSTTYKSGSFSAQQILENATVFATTSVFNSSSFIASDENTLIIKMTSSTSSFFNITVGVDTIYNLPLNSGSSSSNSIWASKGGVTSIYNSMLLMPCDTKTYVIWPSVNTFIIEPTSGYVQIANGSQTPPVCPRRVSSNKLSIGACNDEDSNWILLPVPTKGPNAMQLSLASNNSLCAFVSGPEYHNSGGLVSIGECSTQSNGFWYFINGLIQYNSTQCLTAVPSNVNITIGLVASVVRVSDSMTMQLTSPILKQTSTTATVTAGVSLDSGVDYYVILATATTRDVNWLKDPVETAIEQGLRYSNDIDYPTERLTAHSLYWSTFWNVSEVMLDDSRVLLEGFYYGAQYLLGSTTRLGAIPPGLWGVWCVEDSEGWNGDYTIGE